MDLRERLLQAAEDWGESDYPATAALLREAAAALAAPREPDGWIVEWPTQLWQVVSAPMTDYLRTIISKGVTPVRPFRYIGAPAPAETREQEVMCDACAEGECQDCADTKHCGCVCNADSRVAPAETEARDAE